MRDAINKNSLHDPRINYRGINASRVDNLTDAVFGIAITLLIFNLTNPNSFSDLIGFTKTLPGFLISISFLILFWNEHRRFSEIYSLRQTSLLMLNTLFIALVIFYVYPLRFLMLFLSMAFFRMDLGLSITDEQVPQLMIYYGFVAFALYFILFLFYRKAYQLRSELSLNEFELFYTRSQKIKLAILFSVPLISIVLTAIFSGYSIALASGLGGISYALYMPSMMLWQRWYSKAEKKFK